jgi:methyl-accepting chemotaxis protein
MARTWTFGQRVGAGFGAMVLIVVAIAGGAVYAIDSVSASKDRVIEGAARSTSLVGRMRSAAESKTAAVRSFLALDDEPNLAAHRAARTELLQQLRELRGRPLDAESARLLDAIERAEAAHQVVCDELIAARRADGTAESSSRAYQERALPLMNELRQQFAALATHQERLLARGSREATLESERAKAVLVGASVLVVVLSFAVALLLSRALGRQIGSAVQHVQSSSSELQSAANQQAAGAREQATAMSEITTTISELLATSRQIAESAQRVAHIAEDTAESARGGEQTVARTHEAIAGIKSQVDLIVLHMLELGKKSQQIGGIVEIINELAKQTNILAINATIEAAGAGEAGKRFAVVADEIRKLADRVGGSTKEIRGLIDEVRAAVNTTVMTTEGGTKAVDAGARQFGDVTAALTQIVTLVGTTTEAAREIELSTKQQSTAVEQVNVAVANVAQATRENEASSSQTFQTASQLTTLSRELLRLIQPQASG